MTGGTIVSVANKETLIIISVKDDEGSESILKIQPTNYKISPGDYISWNKDRAYWRSQHNNEKEIIFFREGFKF